MQKRDSAWVGVMLMLFGGLLIIMKFFPEVKHLARSVPFISLVLMGLGVGITVSGLFHRHPRVIFGVFLIQVSAVLIYQSAVSGYWSWKPWLLIPAFLGVGTFVRDLNLGMGFWKSWKDSAILILLGVALFLLFSLRGVIHFLLPAALIIIGIALLFGRKKEA